MPRTIASIILCLTWMVPTGQAQVVDSNAVSLMYQTIASTRAIKTMSYVITKTERIEGELVKQISSTKLSRNPLKVYVRQQYPKEGLEVLYTGKEKVLINPNGFPWFNVRLAPLGNMIRENQHHTILESGYDHVINILEHLINKYEGEVHSMLVIEKDTVWDNHPVWKVSLSNPNYQVSSYQMQKDENVMQVARRDLISEYWLVEQNENLNSCNDEKPGTIIQRPNDYAPRMEVLIDKARLIPMVMKVYDQNGLFEFYAYSDVQIDPVFDEAEFEKDYPEYDF